LEFHGLPAGYALSLYFNWALFQLSLIPTQPFLKMSQKEQIKPVLEDELGTNRPKKHEQMVAMLAFDVSLQYLFISLVQRRFEALSLSFESKSNFRQRTKTSRTQE
jgi:hypothetical protein